MKRQHGFTLGGMFFFLLILVFFVYMGARIGPAYLDHVLVQRTLDKMVSQSGIQDRNEQELRDQFKKELALNNVKHVDSPDLLVERSPGGYRLSVAYTVKSSFLGPVNFCMDFQAAATTSH